MRWAGANCPIVAALLGFNIWITTAMSNITAVADFVLWSEDGLGMPGKRGIRSDFDPLYKLPLLDNAGGPRLISYLKNSLMSASGLAVRFINILVTTLRFALAVLNLASPFLRSADGLFINV